MIIAPRQGLVILLFGLFTAQSAFALRTVKQDLPGLLERTAFIFTGAVEAVDFAAGEATPRTRVTFRVIDLVAGHSVPAVLEVELPMGLMADGTVLDIAEAPRFVEGETYLVLYKRGTWNVTPVVECAFRPGAHGGPIYVSAGGQCVTAVTEKGFILGPRVASRRGYTAWGDGQSEPHNPAHAKGCMPASTLLAALAARVAAFGDLVSDVYDTAPASDILFHRLMGRPSSAATPQKGAPF